MTQVTLIQGDGIGPEITKAVQEIFAAFDVGISWESVDAGLEYYEKSGKLLSDELSPSLLKNKIALKGPTTTPSGSGHRSINVQIRQDYQLFANVRPVKSIEGLNKKFENVDFVIVRENTEDLYKGIEYKVGDDVAHGIKLITRSASTRIGKFACDYAKKNGRKRVTIVHKANIMKHTDGLFLESIQALKADYPTLEINDILIDNCCMQLVKNPSQFDVLVTENLYGDILSDLGAGLIGGLGLASGANIGSDLAVFEAVHGSAPDIAGQGKANPTALLKSALQMLRYMNKADHADQIQKALLKILLNPSTRTGDVGGPLGTAEFTKAIIANR